VNAALFALLRRLHRPALLNSFAESLTGAVIFNPSRSIFGLVALSPLLNQFRACTIDLMVTQAPEMLAAFLVENQNSHFLISEVIGRLIARRSFVLELVNTPDVIRLVVDALIVIRNIGSSFESRVPLFRFFIELLAHDKTSLACLSSDHFMLAFGRLLVKGSVSKSLLSVLGQAVGRVDETAKVDAPLRFLKSAEFAPKDFLLELIGQRPFLAPKLDLFLPQFMHELANSPGEKSLDRALQMLRIASAFQPGFELSTSDFRILAPIVAPPAYPILISLAAASHTVRAGDLFVITRPSFLPLVLIAVAADAAACEQFMTTCISFVSLSDYNINMLHV
jgi:hypothetical protein